MTEQAPENLSREQQYRSDIGGIYNAARALAQHAAWILPVEIPEWDALPEEKQLEFAATTSSESSFITAQVVCLTQPLEVLADVATSLITAMGSSMGGQG